MSLTADLLRAYDFCTSNCIVDVGGGSGAVLGARLHAQPAARGVLFDRPAVIQAAASVGDPSLTDRTQLVSGDFFVSVPAGGDVYLLKSVLHDWTDERARAILTTCRRAMPSGSALLVVERLVPERMRADLLH